MYLRIKQVLMSDHAMKNLLFLFFLCSAGVILAQDSLSVAGDSKYREDQFYVGVTYNLITKIPAGVNIKGLSGGINFGFMRDMPINDRRNIAVALGAGLALDQYGQTLFIGENPDESTIFRTLLDDVEYDKNRLNTAAIEVPFEFRWRTSTATEYKFWRVYAGMRLRYTYWYRSYFRQPDNEVAQTDIPEFQNLGFDATLSIGFGTFNFYVNYALTPYFKDAETENTLEKIGYQPLKLGLIFYIL